MNSTSQIHEFNFMNSTSQIPLHWFNFTNSQIQFHKFNSWIREFTKLYLWSWICDVEIANSWNWNRGFVKLKPWINVVEMSLPVFRRNVLFLLFLYFHSCSSFFPIPLFYLFYYLFYVFLAHVELCCRSAYAMACCPLSVRLSFSQSLALHIFDVSSRTISWIELKLSGRHCGNMEIQNC